MSYDPKPPFRRDFDAARDPYAARNALGIMGAGGGISDAPNDGHVYGRQSLGWTDLATLYQPLDPELAALASVTSAANKLPYFTGAGAAQVTDFTAFARMLVSQPDAATSRTVLGAQTQDPDLDALAALAGVNVIYYRSAANTWAAVTIGAGLSFSGGTLAATGGGGNVSNSGTPAANQFAQWTDATHIQGVSAASVVSTLASAKDAFHAHRNGVNIPSFVNATPVKITCTTETFDQNNKYDNTSNFRWTPAAGLVLISANVQFTTMTAGSACRCLIYKNGALFKQGSYGSQGDAATSAFATITVVDVANGTDYYECWGQVDSAAGGTLSGSAVNTFFQGCQL